MPRTERGGSSVPESIRFAGCDGGEIGGELSAPGAARFAENEAGEVPGILLVHEVFGLDAFVRGVAEEFAGEGFYVLAPDLYAREGLPGPAATAAEPAPIWLAETIRAAVAGLPNRRALRDLEGAAERLAAEPGVDPERLAVIGYCMGGTLAFLLGCTSRRIAAVVSCYGRIAYGELTVNKPVQPLEMALNLEAPFLGLFGAEDASIPLADVRALEERLQQFAKPAEVVVYPDAGHGFCNPWRSGYEPTTALAARERIGNFLAETLSAPELP